jgi:hypothetical protein
MSALRSAHFIVLDLVNSVFLLRSLSLRPRYSPQHPFLELGLCSSLRVRDWLF